MSLQVTEGRAWYMCWRMRKRRRYGGEKEEKTWGRGEGRENVGQGRKGAAI